MPGFKITGKEPDGPSNQIELARKHRFVFTMIGPMSKPQTLYAYKATRPVCEVDKIIMHHGQEEINMAGKERWLPIEITFYEVFDSSDVVSQILYTWRAETVLHVNSSNQGSQSSYKKRCVLQMVDSQDRPVWTYTMLDVWPSKVTPSDVSYEESSFGDITAVLEMSKAVEEGGSASKNKTSMC